MSDAYENRSYVPGFKSITARWRASADAVRNALGPRCERLAYDVAPRNHLFMMWPPGDAPPQGLLFFIHGGYWRSFEAADFLQMGAGALARRFAVAMPSYRLAPEVTLPEITADIAAALTFAGNRASGPIILAGHSAGGHLACRMASASMPLGAKLAARIVHVVTISGLHDLRPLLFTDKNADLGLDDRTAVEESPALDRPRDGTRLTVWVGADERPEFRRQSALIANAWHGLGAAVRLVIAPGRHHFDVIDPLENPESALTNALFDGVLEP
ncbi:MAG: alpha/beta hydrolase [Pseudomonadota bacterium]